VRRVDETATTLQVYGEQRDADTQAAGLTLEQFARALADAEMEMGLRGETAEQFYARHAEKKAPVIRPVGHAKAMSTFGASLDAALAEETAHREAYQTRERLISSGAIAVDERGGVILTPRGLHRLRQEHCQ
jgi:hypothetical protein